MSLLIIIAKGSLIARQLPEVRAPLTFLLDTWFRHLVKVAAEGSDPSYVWHEMTFISQWTPGRCAILCIGIPASFHLLLHRALLGIWPKLPPSEPYSLHVAVVEAIVSLQDSSVWSVRDVVRSIEKVRPTSTLRLRLY